MRKMADKTRVGTMMDEARTMQDKDIDGRHKDKDGDDDDNSG